MTRKEARMIGLDGFPMCSVSSCQVSLMGCRVYNQRCYICPAHQRASEVLQGETYMRFCHQCGRLQPLSDFNGNQRSCAVSLHRRRKGMQEDADVQQALVADAALTFARGALGRTSSAPPDLLYHHPIKQQPTRSLPEAPAHMLTGVAALAGGPMDRNHSAYSDMPADVGLTRRQQQMIQHLRSAMSRAWGEQEDLSSEHDELQQRLRQGYSGASTAGRQHAREEAQPWEQPSYLAMPPAHAAASPALQASISTVSETRSPLSRAPAAATTPSIASLQPYEPDLELASDPLPAAGQGPAPCPAPTSTHLTASPAPTRSPGPAGQGPAHANIRGNTFRPGAASPQPRGMHSHAATALRRGHTGGPTRSAARASSPAYEMCMLQALLHNTMASEPVDPTTSNTTGGELSYGQASLDSMQEASLLPGGSGPGGALHQPAAAGTIMQWEAAMQEGAQALPRSSTTQLQASNVQCSGHSCPAGCTSCFVRAVQELSADSFGCKIKHLPPSARLALVGLLLS